jgi:hypothetical protein
MTKAERAIAISEKTYHALINGESLPDCADDEFIGLIAGMILCSMFYFTLDNCSSTGDDSQLKEKYFDFIEGLWKDFQPMKVWLTGEP